MFTSFRIGKLFDIPIFLHSTFFLLPLIVLYRASQAGMLNVPTFLFQFSLVMMVFLCVLMHEFGHALMARRFGIPTRDITLYPIGGVARLERLSEKPSEELLIAFAGPLVNVAIATLLTPLAVVILTTHSYGNMGLIIPAGQPFSTILSKWVLVLWICNIVLFVFNLLPVYPMDGGRVFRAILASIFTHLRATEIAATVGLVLAFGLGILGIFAGNYMLIFLAVFVVFAGQQELYLLRRHKAMRERAAREGMFVEEVEPSDYTPRPNYRTPPPPFLPSPPPPGAGGFTGVVWDHHYRVWVQWQNGRPIASFPGYSE